MPLDLKRAVFGSAGCGRYVWPGVESLVESNGVDCPWFDEAGLVGERTPDA
jgi:hypothetical protein